MANQPLKEKSVSVTALHLDSQNPRHEVITNEPEIIAALFPKKVQNLAEHIAANGLNPLERIAVLQHPTVKRRFIALEGNRRVCALKLLLDPAKAPTPAAKRAFQRMKDSGSLTIPDKIPVIIFTTRESATKWLSVKHEGPQEGIGTVEWDAGEKAKFNMYSGGKTNPNRQATELLEYAERHNLISKEQASRIAVTTLTRFLKNKAIQDALGLVNSVDLTIDVDPGEFNAALQKFLEDSVKPEKRGEKAAVHSRANATEVQEYAERFNDDGFAATTKLEEPTNVSGNADVLPQAIAAKKVPPRRSVRDADLRPHVIPKSFKLTHEDPVIGRMVKELRGLKPENYAFSCNYLCRAIVERATLLYAKKNTVPFQGRDLHVVVQSCIEDLKKNGVATGPLKGLSVAASREHHWFSVQTLGSGVHGSISAQTTDLKRGWDSIQPGIEALLDGAR